MDQYKAATALGLNRSTYVNYELGRNMPSLESINAIIAHFGVTYEYLMGLDMSHVLLNKNGATRKNGKNVLHNVLSTVSQSAENEHFVSDSGGVEYSTQSALKSNLITAIVELEKAQLACNRAALALLQQKETPGQQ